MNIYQSNAYRKDLSWLHFDDGWRVQKRQQVKDQQSYIIAFVAYLTIPNSSEEHSIYTILISKPRLGEIIYSNCKYSPEPWVYRLNMTSINLLCRYYFAICSSELAELALFLYSCETSNRHHNNIGGTSPFIKRGLSFLNSPKKGKGFRFSHKWEEVVLKCEHH